MTNHIHLNQQAWEVGQWQAILFDDHTFIVVFFLAFCAFPCTHNQQHHL
jgi:hypothetical protein